MNDKDGLKRILDAFGRMYKNWGQLDCYRKIFTSFWIRGFKMTAGFSRSEIRNPKPNHVWSYT